MDVYAVGGLVEKCAGSLDLCFINGFYLTDSVYSMLKCVRSTLEIPTTEEGIASRFYVCNVFLGMRHLWSGTRVSGLLVVLVHIYMLLADPGGP